MIDPPIIGLCFPFSNAFRLSHPGESGYSKQLVTVRVQLPPFSDRPERGLFLGASAPASCAEQEKLVNMDYGRRIHAQKGLHSVGIQKS